MCFFHSSILLYEWSIGYCHATGQKHPIYHCCTWAGGINSSRSIEQSSSSNWNSSSNTSLARHALCRYCPSGALPAPPQRSGTTLPVVHLVIITTRGPIWVSFGLKKGTFWDIFRPQEPHPGIPVEQLLASEGLSLPSLPSPFAFKLTLQAVLLRSFRQSFKRWSGWPHPKQFQFFCWYNSTTLAKWMI